MLRQVLKAKIQKVKVTEKHLYYEGSIGIDGEIIEKVGIRSGDRVQVLNYNNGERFETYVIEEAGGSKKIILYGPAAHKGEIGDEVCIIAYAFVTEDEKIEPKILNG
ncbi:MAG: aspartate 1-decarboxylase [Elusimicrobia bacterium]|nr:aspartate 1-decarboxylase [Elusimicrobiota bacterium]